MNPVRNLRRLAGFLLTGTATLLATSVSQPPAGMDEADWARLRSTLDVARHRIAATAGGHQAHNPGQHWRTRFEGQGFLVQPDGADWQWGLELTAYGFPGREHTVPTGSANTLADVAGSRLEYAWDAGLTEWFVNDARGLEHGFTVHERPDDRQVLECGDRSPLSLHHHWLTDAGQLHDLKEKRRPAGAVQDVDATATRPAIHYPPSTLNFHLAVRGGLRPVVEPDRCGVRFVSADGTTRTTYAGLKVWDADGRTLPAHFEPLDVAHPSEITLAVDERGARYPLIIDPIAQQAYLKASNSNANSFFGWSVAMSADTAVIGAPNEASNIGGGIGNGVETDADAPGGAYIFARSGTMWTQQTRLKSSNRGTGFGLGSNTEVRSNFGWSVAMTDDTVVIGAPNEANSAGAAYVFVRSGTTWTQQAYLQASNPDLQDFFGWSVAISDDTVVIGAIREASAATGVDGNQSDNSSRAAGAAYVFVRDGTKWTQQAYLKASDTFVGSRPDDGDHFGISVAVSGDSIAVGAPEQGGNSGAVYVFTRRGTRWSQQAYLKASNAGAFDHFGGSVSISGNTIVAGAPYESSSTTGVNNAQNNAAEFAGAAYVFVRDGTVWTQQAFLKASNTGAQDHFGGTVTVSGDIVVVGAGQEDSVAIGVDGNQRDNSAEYAGAAYVFTRSGTKWSQQAYLKASNTGSGDQFGSSAAVAGNTAIIGAFGEASRTTGVNGNQDNNNAPWSGAAYIFEFKNRGIKVELPHGVSLTDGASASSFGTVAVGGSDDLIFTVRNLGVAFLTGFELTIDGTDADQFNITTDPVAPVVPGESTTFTVRFSPTSEGTKTATLHIASNDPVHNTFDITLVGTPNVPTVAMSGNDLTVSFVGTPGRRYRVQYALGVAGQWNEFNPPALYSVPANGVFSHADPNPPDILRLYRAVLEP